MFHWGTVFWPHVSVLSLTVAPVVGKSAGFVAAGWLCGTELFPLPVSCWGGGCVVFLWGFCWFFFFS